jgi:tellurite resistance protein TerC
MATSIWFWIGFCAFLALMLALDLGVFHRKAHEVRFREALGWSVAWAALALAFNGWIWWSAGSAPAMEFLTGWLIEKSLSVDNIFVIATVFSYFAIPAQYQHRVLFWGVLGALAMRAVFIGAGAYVLERWHWIIYVFGGLLVLTGLKLALKDEAPFDGDRDPVVRFARRLIPLTTRYDGQKFWTRENGRRVATPLFLTLLLVEFTDLVFAVDSIPAIFAVTRDPFLVFTSNAFAILGLRSLYFVLADVMHRFAYLKYGLAAVLAFVGTKMMLMDFYKIPTAVSLLVVAAILGSAIGASWLRSRQGAGAEAGAVTEREAAAVGERAALPD